MGIHELVNRAGVPKGSFYNHFSSKEAFAITAIEDYTKQRMTMLSHKLHDAEGSPLERLTAFYLNWANDFEHGDRRGCLLANLSQEVSNQRPQIQQMLAQCYEQGLAEIVKSIQNAQEAKELSSEVSTHEIAFAVYNGWNGALIYAKAIQSNQPLLQFCQSVLPTLLAQNNSLNM